MKWLKEWRVKLAILVGILNMELVVIPIILKGICGLGGVNLKIAATIWATGEIYFWYLFSGWLMPKIKKLKEILEMVDISREAIPEVRSSKFFRQAEAWIQKNIIDRFDHDKYRQRRAYLILKGCGYVLGVPLFFASGLVPILWIFGIIATRVRNWKLGFWLLILGNVVKNIGFAEGWDRIWIFFRTM